MEQRICDHCGHPSPNGWAEIHFTYMARDVKVDVCPDCVRFARKALRDFAVFCPGLFHDKD